MCPEAHSAGRVRGPRTRVGLGRRTWELREPSFEGAQSSRVRRRLRSERGQAAVEFAMVVPLLCLFIVAILHFGKVMNYWLDLNHVASEGARKAAVNTFASDGAYDTYVRNRLETAELRTGGTSSIPAPSTDQRLPAGGRRRRRPGDGAGRGRLQPAVHRQDDHSSRQGNDADGAARGLRGRRSVRVSTGRNIADLAAREDGGILVFVAMLTPIIMLFLALRRRHRQLVGAQAAPAAPGRTPRHSPAARSWASASPTLRPRTWRSRTRRRASAAAAGSSYNEQLGGTQKGSVALAYQSNTYPSGAADPDGDTETALPCDTAHLMFDVKASEEGIPLLLRPLLELVAPGTTLADPTVNAHARVELKQVEIQEGLLPVAVPDLRFNYVFATFVNEVTGAELGTIQLTKAGSSGADQLWNTTTPVSVSIPSAHVGVRVRLVGGADPTAACGTLFTECYDTDSTNGVVHIRGWSAGTAPAARNAWLLAGLLRARRVLRDRRLQRRDPGRGRPRRPVPAHRHRRHRRRLGERRRRRPPLAHPGRHVRARHLDRDRRASPRRERPARRRAELELGADHRHVEREELQAERQPVQGRRHVRSGAAGVPRGRPLGPAPQRPGLRERRHDLRQQLLRDRARRTRSGSASPSPAASRCSRSRPTR